MESVDTNSYNYWPLDGAQKCNFLSFLDFTAPSSGQQLQPLVSRDWGIQWITILYSNMLVTMPEFQFCKVRASSLVTSTLW